MLSQICRNLSLLLLLTGCGKAVPSSDQAAASDLPGYTYGTVVSFAQGGESETYRNVGWSKPEEKFIWTEGHSATLAMNVKPTDDPISLRMTLGALINPPSLPAQPVEIDINNRKITEWSVGVTATFTAALPAEITKVGGNLTITLKTPKAASPKTLGQGNDARVLGVSCFSFELSKSP